MSIADQVTRCCDSGTLVEFRPIAPISTLRPVYLVPEVCARIVGPWTTAEERSFMPQVQADLENFIEGGWINATFRMRPNAYCKRLQDGSKSVWELRTIDPAPGVRIFGMFAMKDVFIGTGMLLRSELNDCSFKEEIRNTKAKWRNILHTYAPVVSENINDYITENVVQLPQP